MPAITPYTEVALDALPTVSARGLHVHIRIRDTAVAVADLFIPQAELDAMARRSQFLASEDETREHEPLPGGGP